MTKTKCPNRNKLVEEIDALIEKYFSEPMCDELKEKIEKLLDQYKPRLSKERIEKIVEKTKWQWSNEVFLRHIDDKPNLVDLIAQAIYDKQEELFMSDK